MSEELIISERELIGDAFDNIEKDPDVLDLAVIISHVHSIGPQFPETTTLFEKDPEKYVFAASVMKPIICTMIAYSLATTGVESDEVKSLINKVLVDSDDDDLLELYRLQSQMLGVKDVIKLNQVNLDTIFWNKWLVNPHITFNNADSKEEKGVIFTDELEDGKTVEILKIPPTKGWNSGPMDEIVIASMLPYFPEQACDLMGIKDPYIAHLFKEYLQGIVYSLSGDPRYIVPSIKYWLPNLGILEKDGWWLDKSYRQRGYTHQKRIPSIDTKEKRTVFASTCAVPTESGFLVLAHNIVLGQFASVKEAEQKIIEITEAISNIYQSTIASHQ